VRYNAKEKNNGKILSSQELLPKTGFALIALRQTLPTENSDIAQLIRYSKNV